jgi:hypothetical protein
MFTWVKWGQGDLAGALVECEQMQLAAELPDLSAERHEELRKAHLWAHAFILAQIAAVQELASRAATLGHASDARAAFERLATKPHDRDSKFVLAAAFGIWGGDGKAAAEAARQVDVAHDDDLQDLYIVARALEAGGDRAQAKAIYDRIRSNRRVHMMRPVVLHLMERDAAPTCLKKEQGFTTSPG